MRTGVNQQFIKLLQSALERILRPLSVVIYTAGVNTSLQGITLYPLKNNSVAVSFAEIDNKLELKGLLDHLFRLERFREELNQCCEFEIFKEIKISYGMDDSLILDYELNESNISGSNKFWNGLLLDIQKLVNPAQNTK